MPNIMLSGCPVLAKTQVLNGFAVKINYFLALPEKFDHFVLYMDITSKLIKGLKNGTTKHS